MSHDDEGPSRFSYLEVDDDKPRAVREQERETAEDRRRAAEVAHAAELLRLEQERTEESERRSRAKKERRSGRAKQKRTLNKAKDNLNTWLSKIGRKYHENRSDIIDEILLEAAKEGFEHTGEIKTSDTKEGSDRRIYVMEDGEGKDYGLVISTYQMPSGRWEVTSYIS